jgi:hypothetical protein
MQLSPISYSFMSLRSTYSPLHPVLKHRNCHITITTSIYRRIVYIIFMHSDGIECPVVTEDVWVTYAVCNSCNGLDFTYTLKMESECFSETLVTNYQTKRFPNAEDHHLEASGIFTPLIITSLFHNFRCTSTFPFRWQWLIYLLPAFTFRNFDFRLNIVFICFLWLSQWACVSLNKQHPVVCMKERIFFSLSGEIKFPDAFARTGAYVIFS